MPVFSHNEIYFSGHVFVVQGFTNLKIDAFSEKVGFLVVSGSTKLVEKSFFAHYFIQNLHSFVDISIANKNCARNEFGVPHFYLDDEIRNTNDAPSEEDLRCLLLLN